MSKIKYKLNKTYWLGTVTIQKNELTIKHDKIKIISYDPAVLEINDRKSEVKGNFNKYNWNYVYVESKELATFNVIKKHLSKLNTKREEYRKKLESIDNEISLIENDEDYIKTLKEHPEFFLI